MTMLQDPNHSQAPFISGSENKDRQVQTSQSGRGRGAGVLWFGFALVFMGSAYLGIYPHVGPAGGNTNPLGPQRGGPTVQSDVSSSGTTGVGSGQQNGVASSAGCNQSSSGGGGGGGGSPPPDYKQPGAQSGMGDASGSCDCSGMHCPGDAECAKAGCDEKTKHDRNSDQRRKKSC